MAQVVLMGVSVGPGPGDATLQPLHYRTSADGVIMTTVASTEMGRIFLGGADGHLYELKYTVGGMQKVVADCTPHVRVRRPWQLYPKTDNNDVP